MVKEKTIHLEFRIDQIQTIKFSFEDLTAGEIDSLFHKENKLALNLSHDIEILKDEKLIICTTHSQLVNVEKNEAVLIEHKGQTKYHVENLEEFYNEKENRFFLPDDFMIHLMSIAFNHTRALLAVETNQTPYKGYYILPYIDPQEFLKQ